MKIAYLDCFSGIAGDMALAALLDCGVPLDALKQGLASLPVEGWDITAEQVLSSGIHAQSVRITLHGVSDDEELATMRQVPEVVGEGEKHDAHGHHHEHRDEHGDEAVEEVSQEPHDLTSEESHSHEPHSHQHAHSHHSHHAHTHEDEEHQHHEHSHGHHHHDHAHDHDHSHGHDHHHDHAHSHSHDHHHGRSMAEIRDLINASELSEKVKATAFQIFEKIAVAEAYLHHSTPDEIHFHEIGGLDSLLDIVGVAWCLDYLGVDAVYCSALPHSTGFVDCAHGRMPVPAPATLEILKGAPWEPTGLKGELVTPTGAGIVAALAQGFGSMPAMTLESIGLGAGKKQLPDRPNILRITIGEAVPQVQSPEPVPVTASAPAVHQPAGLEWSSLVLLQTNIDDMNPQLFEVVIEAIFAAGALDAWTTPIGMKKGRPAQELSVLCEPKTQNDVLSTILRETTTIGVRVQTVQRAALQREMSEVETPWGKVRAKVVWWNERNLVRAHPEWEDVKALSQQAGVSALEIYAQANALARQIAQSQG